MNMKVPFVKTKSGINLYINGVMESIATDHPNYAKVSDLLLSESATVENISTLVNIPLYANKVSKGHITISGEDLYYDGKVLHNALTVRIVDLMKHQKPVASLVAFMDNLMLNPSYRAVNELYKFLDACTLPITTDGYFLAYKKVSSAYKSIHASPDGSHLDHSIGSNPKMPRNQVNEDPNQTCSDGLHCCSFGYLSSYSSSSNDRVVIVKVNPKDVVAVPTDYDNQKMRVCEYFVVGEIPNDEKTEIKDKFTTNRYSESPEYEEDDFDDYEEGDEEDDLEVQTSNPATAPVKDIRDWECRDANDPDAVDAFYKMTRNQAKAAFGKKWNVDYMDVRCRMIKQ